MLSLWYILFSIRYDQEKVHHRSSFCLILCRAYYRQLSRKLLRSKCKHSSPHQDSIFSGWLLLQCGPCLSLTPLLLARAAEIAPTRDLKPFPRPTSTIEIFLVRGPWFLPGYARHLGKRSRPGTAGSARYTGSVGHENQTEQWIWSTNLTQGLDPRVIEI